MTLDEAIAHCHEKAKELRQSADLCMLGTETRNDCLECANEHEQLAEWLEELKARREADKKGEWKRVLINTDGTCQSFMCSNCRAHIYTIRPIETLDYNACPYCFADMRKENDK